ncbi:hypothetical protein [Kineobactrum salinum]|uniref:Transcriptional regulator SutA RNAP-binding domain-containing protein n=1 Tax=Kineobactrum salinum TaxID=2708301 RepID=A0A6C0U9C7_9GAMM|nr:hypothetical protein [Kineobactrum salinum]QIB67235.1 hypothetical protein G3T16_19350 [Kineobactrum salinum]
MRHSHSNTAVSSKERVRHQIRIQVDDFLRRGGKIRVLDRHDSAAATPVKATIWQNHDEVLDLLA